MRKNNIKSLTGYFLSIIVLLVQACTFLGNPIQPSPQASPTNVVKTDSPSPTPVTSTQTQPVTSPKATPLVTSSPKDILCVKQNPQVPLKTGSFEDYPIAVLDFLNNGGTPKELDEALYKVGIANQPIAVSTGDLTGDNKEDVVVSIFNPQSTSIPPGGKILIYICSDSRLKLSYQLSSKEEWGAPGIRYQQDLDGDGIQELVTSSATCGAHTCFEDVQILAWNGKNFVNKLTGITTDLPYPDIRIKDSDGDGVYDLEVAGSGIGSVGAGPQRNVMRTWKFDPVLILWSHPEDVLDSSNYRIHVLHDADTAARKGDYAQALLFYGRVVQDTTLQDWMDPERERANLAAYALFKTALLYFIQGQPAFAQITLDQLRNTYPSGTSQHRYVEMAEIFQQTYTTGGVASGCIAVRDYSLRHSEDVLEPLGSASFGYANPNYKPADICPWPEPAEE